MLTALRRWIGRVPLAAKVLTALSVALLPLGIASLLAAWRSYVELRGHGIAITAVQVFGVTLPLLMWIAALGVAAVSLSVLVVRPLRHMASTVQRYGAGDLASRMDDGELASPELAEVSSAFNAMADRAAAQAEAMADALATQRALTREVHHRVKNNLQIVSSLLSIQARDAVSEDVAAAYALIRQRVNALALVHRWMYQDESARGVDLRSLLADLGANLEHGFEPRSGSSGRVTTMSDRLSVGQDTALPIAFLVTELVGAARLADDGGGNDVEIEARRHGETARLSVSSRAFGAAGTGTFHEGARRIVAGLARQLRSPLAYDADTHCFTITFPALGPAA